MSLFYPIQLNSISLFMNKIIFIASLLLVQFCNTGNAQTKYSSLTDALSNGANLSGASGPASVNWVDGGKKYSFKAAGGVIKLYDPATDKEEIIFDPANEKFPGSGKKFTYATFQWSKDFQFIVFRTNIKPVWRNSGYADYYMYSRSSKTMKLIAATAYTAEISPDGKKVGYESNGNLFVTELATGKTKQLTNDAKDFFYNGRFGWAYEEEFGLVQAWEWSADGEHIAFWQSDEREVPVYRYTDYVGFKENFKSVPYPKVGDKNPTVKIGVVNINSGKLNWMKVDASDSYIPRIYWTAEKNKLAIVHLNRKQNHMQLFFADILTGNTEKIFEEKSDTWLEVFSFGAGILHFFYFTNDRKEFMWVSERDGWQHIYRYNYDGKLINQVTKGNWEVAKVHYIDYRKNKIFYTSTEASPLEQQLYSINIDGSNKTRLTQVAGKHSINFGGEYFIDSYSNTNLPKQVDLRDATGKMIKKIQSNDKVTEFIKSHAYSPKELMQFTTTDGQKIDIGVIKPFNFDPAKKYPLYLDVYGGPAHQDVFNQFETNSFHQYLAQLGYVVIQINNRGSSSYGVAFKNIVYGKLGQYECYDFAEAAKYMSSFPWIDKNRIGIKGHSYGGFTAAYSIMNYPEIYKTAIIAAPVSDWRNYDAIYTERFMGVLPENEANYNKCAVLTYADKLKAKVLITHSTSDDNVHVRNSMQLIKKLIDVGKDADQRIYQSGGHGIAYDFNSAVLLSQQYVDFLEKNLK